MDGFFQKRICPVCGSRKVRAAHTYKHSWLWCSDCGSASRGPNHTYLFERLPGPLQKLLVKLLPRLRHLMPDPDVTRDGSRLYDHMAEHGYINEGELSREYFSFKRWMEEKLNLSIQGSRVLDISGGNGYMIRQFQRNGAECVLTEYNRRAVEYARDVFGLEAYVYDFNQHQISEVVPGKFDLVLLRAALMYCLDVPAFLASLRPSLNPGARVVIFESAAPTLGAMLRFQLNDYMFLRMYSPRAVVRLFEESGYQLLVQDDNAPFPYGQGTSLFWRLFGLLFELPVGLACGDFQRTEHTFNFMFKVR